MVMHSRIPKIPIFVDSPLAIKATAVFNKFRNDYNADVQEAMRKDPEIFNFKGLKFTSTVDESKSINDVPPPKVILAGSGMSTGGRILHHELRYLPDPRSMLLLVGYQSGGSLGRRLSDGASEVKILKEMVSVRAEIRKVAGFSAHADGPQLFNFVKRGRASLKRVFVVQGENEAAAALAQEIKDQLGVTAETPSLYEKVVLE
jgi:metallo-beta-lactamase family protein